MDLAVELVDHLTTSEYLSVQLVLCFHRQYTVRLEYQSSNLFHFFIPF